MIYQIFIHTSKTIIETYLYPIWVISFVFWHLLDIFSLMHSWFILQPWSKLVHYQSLLVHEKQAIIETNPKSSTHVSFVICQICLLSHDVMISHNIEAISLIPFILLSLFELDCFHNPLIQQFSLHFNTVAYHEVCLLVEPWTYLLIHNPQVYAIDSICC